MPHRRPTGARRFSCGHRAARAPTGRSTCPSSPGAWQSAGAGSRPIPRGISCVSSSRSAPGRRAATTRTPNAAWAARAARTARNGSPGPASLRKSPHGDLMACHATRVAFRRIPLNGLSRLGGDRLVLSGSVAADGHKMEVLEVQAPTRRLHADANDVALPEAGALRFPARDADAVAASPFDEASTKSEALHEAANGRPAITGFARRPPNPPPGRHTAAGSPAVRARAGPSVSAWTTQTV